MWGMDTKHTIVFLAPLGLLVLLLLAWLLLRKTFRTRYRLDRQFRADPDTDEWMIAFNWSRKVLYIPTVIVSLLAAGLMLGQKHGLWPGLNQELVGGVWLAVFIVNFLVDEYEMNLKVLLIGLLFMIALALWLAYMDWVGPFLGLFRHVGMSMSAGGYLMMALVLLAAIAVSWLKGLFYFVAMTPNYMNIQSGPTETAEQVSREAYSTRIDTGDVMERVLGFGRIIITFSDTRRPPLVLLVGRVGRRAQLLESIRGVMNIDRHTKTPELM